MAHTPKNQSEKAILTARRAWCYLVLVLISFLCLFFFYVLVINSTRTHFEIQKGFSFLPGKSLMTNLKNGNLATASTEKWEPATWPTECRGVGFTEAPRGALGHWAAIRDGKIDLYQCVVPTTWNASPRDPKGQIGAYEAALMNTKMAIPEQPLEILRTLHSFDPCLACSTHVLGDDGSELISVQVR